MRIRNFVQLTEFIGTGGQPTVREFTEILHAGYEEVINLAMPEHSDSIDNEGEIVSALGMNYTHIPVPFDSPSPDHVKQFCGYMQALKGRKVFVHCIMNYRVSAFMYHYLHKVEGFSEDAARPEIFLSWQPDEIWRDLLSWDKEKIGL